MDVAVAGIFLALKDERGDFRAHAAIDAAEVVVVGARNIVGHFIFGIRHVRTISRLSFCRKFINGMDS
jgi:hypothetical protein